MFVYTLRNKAYTVQYFKEYFRSIYQYSELGVFDYVKEHGNRVAPRYFDPSPIESY